MRWLKDFQIFIRMKSKFIFTLTMLVGIPLIMHASNPEGYTLISSIPFPGATFFTTDKLGNSYVVVENQLLQFDPAGIPLANFSLKSVGNLRFVDASNPMKILLFYPDFAQIIVLDAKLSLQSQIDLRSLRIFQPLTACTSKENGYWIYDREDDVLKKLDFNLQVVAESGNLSQVIGYQIRPGLMVEENGLIYINNPETGILVFDRLGTYYKTISYQNLVSFQVIDKDVLFITNNKLMRLEFKSLSEKEVLLPQHDSIRIARIEQDKLYLLTSDSLNFYSF
jgi:primosomal replication protein N